MAKVNFILLLFFIFLLAVKHSFAQNPFTIIEPDLQDLKADLEMLGITSLKIKIPESGTNYSIEFLVEEYSVDSLINTIDFSFTLGETRKKISLADNKDTVHILQSIRIVTNAPNEGDPEMQIKATNTIAFKLGLDKEKYPNKHVLKPFKVSELLPEEFMPVALYGSWWYDEKYDITRFCTDNEMEPDYSNDAFSLMPHYYIIKVKFKEKAEK